MQLDRNVLESMSTRRRSLNNWRWESDREVWNRRYLYGFGGSRD